MLSFYKRNFILLTMFFAAEISLIFLIFLWLIRHVHLTKTRCDKMLCNWSRSELNAEIIYTFILNFSQFIATSKFS